MQIIEVMETVLEVIAVMPLFFCNRQIADCLPPYVSFLREDGSGTTTVRSATPAVYETKHHCRVSDAHVRVDYNKVSICR